MRLQVQWFAEQMEAKLKENDHKGGWEDCSIDYFLERLEEEVKELYYATETPNNAENIIREATDVANFALMIADVINRKLGDNHGRD